MLSRLCLTRNPAFSLNDALRHKERRRVFNVNGLSRLAAESVDRSPDDIVSLEKLAEGGFNRTFLITMRDDFQLIARIPYLVTVPKPYAVASEVATMDFLRSSGLPIPNVYGYSPTSDNAAETEHIFMEFVDGTKLSDIWFDLGEREVESVVRQLVQLETKMMSVSFPAGGSLYYVQDLERVAGKPGIPLKDERFCIGPDVRLPLWYGRRSLLDVDRGPCTPLSVFFFRYSFELADNSRQKCRIHARRNSQQGTGVPTAVRPTAVAVPAYQEGKLPIPGAVTVRSRRQPATLSPHRVVTRPQGPLPQSFPHPPSRPPGDQYRRFEVVRLWLAGRQRVGLATRLHPTRISPCQYTPTPAELRRSCLSVYGPTFATGEL